MWEGIRDTHVKNLGKAVVGIEALATKIQSDNQLEYLDTVNPETGLSKWDEVVGLKDRLASANDDDTLNQLIEDANAGRVPEVEYLQKVLKSSNRFTAAALAGRLKNMMPSIGQELESWVTRPEEQGGLGLQLTSDTLSWAYETRKREVIRQLGLGDSKGATEIRDLFDKQRFLRYNVLKTRESINEGSKNVSEALVAYDSNPDEKNLALLYSTIQSSAFDDGRGGIIRYSGNEIQKKALELIAYKFPDTTSAVDAIIDGPSVGASFTTEWTTDQDVSEPGTTVWSEVTRDRYKGKKGAIALEAFRKELDGVVSDQIIKHQEQEKKLLKSNSILSLTDLQNKVEEGTLEFQTEEGYNNGIKLLKSYKQFEGQEAGNNPAVYLRKQLGLAPGTYLTQAAEREYVIALRDGDRNELVRLYPNLTKAQKDFYLEKDTQVQALLQAEGGDYTELNNFSKQALRDNAQYTTIDQTLSTSAKDLIPHMSQRVRDVFFSLKEDNFINAEARLQSAKDLVKKELEDGIGIFQPVVNTAGATATGDNKRHYKLTFNEPKQNDYIKDRSVLRDKFNAAGSPSKSGDKAPDFTALFDQLKAEGSDVSLFISPQATGNLAVQLQQDKSIDLNSPPYQNFYELAVLSGTSPKEIANQWLTYNGYKYQLKDSYHDLALKKAYKLDVNVDNLQELDAIKVTEALTAIKEFPEAIYTFMSPKVKDRHLTIKYILERRRKALNLPSEQRIP